MKKTLLFGEPMALLLADTPGALEGVEHFLQEECPGRRSMWRLGLPGLVFRWNI